MASLPKIDPTRLYISLESYAGPKGSARQGELVRGSDPRVLATPSLWIEQGFSDAEVRAELVRRFGDHAANFSHPQAHN